MIETAAFGGVYGSVREESRESRELPRNCEEVTVSPLSQELSVRPKPAVPLRGKEEVHDEA
jgi:hypothetical protein